MTRNVPATLIVIAAAYFASDVANCIVLDHINAARTRCTIMSNVKIPRTCSPETDFFMPPFRVPRVPPRNV